MIDIDNLPDDTFVDDSYAKAWEHVNDVLAQRFPRMPLKFITDYRAELMRVPESLLVLAGWRSHSIVEHFQAWLEPGFPD